MFFNKLLVDGFLPPIWKNMQPSNWIIYFPKFRDESILYISNIWVATTRKITIRLHSLIHPPPRAPPQKKQGCLMISPAKRQFCHAFSGPRCRCMEVVTKRAASESNWVWGPKRMSTNPKVICNAQNHDVKHESSWSSWWLQPILQRWVNLDHFPM